MLCPACGSARVHRSRRNGKFERDLLAALSVYPFRCQECRCRFYRIHRRNQEQQNALGPKIPRWLSTIAWSAVLVFFAIAIGIIVAEISR